MSSAAQKVSNYVLGNSIGRGSFGSVFYCVHKETGKEFAIKVLSKSALKKQTIFCATDDDEDAVSNQLKQLYKEIRFMIEHQHPLLMRLQEVIDFKQEDKIYVVLEIAEGIICAIQEDKTRCPVSEAQMKKFPQLEVLSSLVTQPVQPLTLFSQMHQVAIALAYLHALDYVHGDLKQANVLRMNDGRYVLGDFGLTQKESSGRNYKQAVSPAFASPESKGLTKANDVWGFGVIFFMNLMGYHPAGIVCQYCSDKGVEYKQAHWGLFIEENHKLVKTYFLKQVEYIIQSWKNQYQQIQKLYNVKVEIDSVSIFLEVTAQIVFQCFAPIEKRPTMFLIATKLNEVYCKYHASRIQKYFTKNTNVQQILLKVNKEMRFGDPEQLGFILKLPNFRTYKQEYLTALDYADVRFEQINFQPFSMEEVVENFEFSESISVSVSTHQQQYAQLQEVSVQQDSDFECNDIAKNNAVYSRHRNKQANKSSDVAFLQQLAENNKAPKKSRDSDDIKIELRISSADGQFRPFNTLLHNYEDNQETKKQVLKPLEVSRPGSGKSTQMKPQTPINALRKHQEAVQTHKMQKMQSSSPRQFQKNALNSQLNLLEVDDDFEVPNIKAKKQQDVVNQNKPRTAAEIMLQLQQKKEQQTNFMENSDSDEKMQCKEQKTKQNIKQLDDDSDSGDSINVPKEKQQAGPQEQKQVVNQTKARTAAEIMKQLQQKKEQQQFVEDSDQDEQLKLKEQYQPEIVQQQNLQAEKIVANQTKPRTAAEIMRQLKQKKEQQSNLDNSDSDNKCQTKAIGFANSDDEVDNTKSKQQEEKQIINRNKPRTAAEVMNQLQQKKESNNNLDDSDSENQLAKSGQTTQKAQLQDDKQITNQNKPRSAAEIMKQLQQKNQQADNLTDSDDDISAPTKLPARKITSPNNQIQTAGASNTSQIIKVCNDSTSSDITNMSQMPAKPANKIKDSFDLSDEERLDQAQQQPEPPKQRRNIMNMPISPSAQITHSASQQAIPGVIFPGPSKAQVLAKQFSNTNMNSNPDDDDDGPMNIASAKPVKQPVLPPMSIPIPNLRLNTIRQNATEPELLLKVTPRNLNITQTALVENDDMFDAFMEEQKMKDEKEKELEQEKQQKQTKQSGDVFNIEQRQNFFLKLDQHYQDLRNLFNDQQNVNKLFQKIGYSKDPSISFKYNHDEDQNQLIGLGSFGDVETLSAGKREDDGMDDFSDDDGDLVEFDDDNDDEVNKVLNLDEFSDDENAKSGLLAAGKGKFQTLQEHITTDYVENVKTEFSADSSSVISENYNAHMNLQLPVNEEEVELPKFLSARTPVKFVQNNNGGLDFLPIQSLNQKINSNLSINSASIPGAPKTQFVSGKLSAQFDDSFDDDLSDDLTVSQPQTQKPMQIPSAVSKPLFSLDLSVKSNQQTDKEDNVKLSLFDEDDDNIKLTTDQRLTARMSVRKQHVPNSMEMQVQQGLMSARQEQKGQNPDSVDLTPKQTVIYFRQAILYFNLLNYQIQQQYKNIYNDPEYQKLTNQFINPVQLVQKGELLLQPINIDDMLCNFILWKTYLEKQREVNKSPLLQLSTHMIQRTESLLDTPAFLRPQCGWILSNSFTLFQYFDKLVDQVNNMPGNDIGFQLSINNGTLIQTKKERFHDLQIYIGLEKAECTPVVGIRHKSDVRTLAIQSSTICIPFKENDLFLQDSYQKSTPIIMSNESYTNLQSKYFAFKFLKLKINYDYNQYEYKRSLYSLVFISLNKQVMMPYVLLDSLIDLIFNARKNSKPSTIRASLFNSNDNFYMIVSDAGSGMGEEQTVSSFSPKDIGSQKKYTREFGNGSGISKLKMVVGFYGGIVNISSVESGGTKVIVKIPMVGDLDNYSIRQ